MPGHATHGLPWFVSFTTATSSASGISTLIARTLPPAPISVVELPKPGPPFLLPSSSGSMLEARRLSGEDERLGTSASPFMMARWGYRRGDWPLAARRAGPVSSPPRSLSIESSAYAEAHGLDAAEEA